MTVKINLTLDEKTIKKAKAYAEKHNTSVSKIVQQQLDKLLSNINGKKEKSFVEKWAGVIKNGPIDIEKEKEAYLKEKHGI